MVAIYSARLREILRSTSFRLGLVQAGTFAVSVSLLMAFVSVSAGSWLTHQIDQYIRDDLAALVDEANTSGLAAAATRIRRLVASPDQSGQFYLLLDREGRRLAGNAPRAPAEVGWFEMPLSTDTKPGDRPKNREHILRGRAIRVADGGLLLVGRDLWSAGQVREVINRGFIVSLLATIVLAMMLSLMASIYVLRRVQTINRASQEIMGGDLRRRIAMSGRNDEFDGLVAQLNAMLDRIGDLLQDIGQVTNDIAHDLRTPLARLRQRLEMARRKARSVAEYELAVDDAIRETDAALATFTSLLRIAQIDAGTRRAGFTTVDLSALVAALVDTYALVADDGRRSLAGTVEPGITIRGDRELLNQLFANLIENSLTHTPPGSHVMVAVSRDADRGTRVSVADDGPGIPAAMRDRVLKPFVRLDNNRAGAGTGLGLAGVAAIARLHGIALELTDGHPGLKVVVRFPPV